ncbi:MAG: PAS domain S-box protein, partial [Firmicutes bacterium]|nr:PAS domain S-box protein [Bacillota bacterium]
MLQLDELLAELALIVWEADLETLQPTFISRGIEKLLGYSPEELLVSGQFWKRIVHPEDIEAMHAMAERAQSEDGTVEHEFRAIARNGRLVWLRNRLRRIETVPGQVQRLRGVASDITEYKRAEERLRLSDEILQRVPALVLVADREGRITYASPSAQEILGYRPEELLGDGWWLLSRADPEERKRERNAVAGCARGERPLPAAPYERIAHHRNGQPRWILWHDSPGPNQTLIGVGHDITARKRAEQQLKERTAYLHALIENSPLAIVVLDPEQRVQMCNRAFTTLFGYRQAEILGGLIDEFLAPPELKSEAVAFSRLALAGQTVHATTRRRRKDGSLVTVEVTGVPLTVDGRRVGGIGIYQDITERLHAEAALRETHHLLETIIQTSPLATIVLDKAGRVKLWNRAAERIFGWSAAEVLNQFLPIIPEERREEFRQLLDAELQGHAQAGLLLQRQRKDGSQVAVRLWSAPLCDASRQYWGVMGVLEDVTEKCALEEQLRQAQKLEAVGRLAGGVAHDFNNLLMVIFGSVELLLDRLPVESPLRHHAEEILKAAQHAANLTRQLLAFSRKQVLQPRGLDLNAVVRDIGLIASEGRITIPMADGTPAGVLDVTTHYFEFIPEAEGDSAAPTVLGAHELEEGKNYFILPTTSYGLYRYHIYDVVRVAGFHNRTPVLEFLSKGAHFANLTGEKLSEYHVVHAMRDVTHELNLNLTTYSLAPCWEEERPYYGLFLEKADLVSRDQGLHLAEALDRRLAQLNSEYACKRETLRLDPIRLQLLPNGTWQLWDRQRLARCGGTPEQYKHPCLINDL